MLAKLGIEPDTIKCGACEGDLQPDNIGAILVADGEIRLVHANTTCMSGVLTGRTPDTEDSQ